MKVDLKAQTKENSSFYKCCNPDIKKKRWQLPARLKPSQAFMTDWMRSFLPSLSIYMPFEAQLGMVIKQLPPLTIKNPKTH